MSFWLEIGLGRIFGKKKHLAKSGDITKIRIS